MSGYNTGFGFGGGRGRGRGRGSGRGGGGGGGGPSPALLTANIKNAKTLEELLGHCTAHRSRLNHIHLSAAWNSIGHKSGSVSIDWWRAHDDSLGSLASHTAKVVSDSSEVRAREMANIAHGVAKSGRGGDLTDLMDALARAVEKRASDCNAQELANVSWAFAKADHCADVALFDALAKATVAKASACNSQELTNLAWAFATAGRTDDEALFSSLARAVEGKLASFTTQGLSNTAWAFAKVGHLDAALFQAVSGAARSRLKTFNAQDFANTAWAFAKLGQFDGELFTALAKDATRHGDGHNAQGLANTVWSFAKAGHLDEGLFTGFASQIRRKLKDFNSQDLANTAWAFAKACHPDESLFASISGACVACLDDFNAQDLVNTAWAFAKLAHFDQSLFAAVARRFRESGAMNDGQLSAQFIANVAWAFSKASEAGKLEQATAEELFADLATAAEASVGDFTAADLANVAWAFANANQMDPTLFQSLANRADNFLDDFNDEELDNAEWAFARAGMHRIVKRLKQNRKRAVEDAAALKAEVGEVDVSGCGTIVVAGGGVGGAACAVALQKRGFNVVVLESDPSFDSRKQGYGLTVQRQDAVNAMGIDLAADDAPSTSHYTFDDKGRVLGVFGEAFGGKDTGKERKECKNSGRFIHIPRQVLRRRILEAVRPGTIRWNSALEGFRTSKKNPKVVKVKLAGGDVIDAALLVGSDGIFSTVRRNLALPGDRLNYVGLMVVLGIVEDSILDVPLTKRRIFETVDGSTRIYAMPFTTSSTMWQLSFPMEEKEGRELAKDQKALKKEITRRCAAWHDPIPELLKKTPLDCFSGYPVYDRELLEPDVLRKAAVDAGMSRVTLVGDAAHPMTPFKAQGANQAISDAVLLADTLADGVRKHGVEDGFDKALPTFEQKMLNRSSRMVVGSREKAKEMHSNLALRPARKVQRETDVDMMRVIKMLRAKGIGATSANDKRGLDAAVSDVMRQCAGGGVIEGADEGDDKKKKRERASDDGKTKLSKKQKVLARVDGEWVKCTLIKTKDNGKHKVKLKGGDKVVVSADGVKVVVGRGS
jgi:2-polyprenyl-6-methoxyphenol hydroxylase-like FAD-dependent oxidoreductase